MDAIMLPVLLSAVVSGCLSLLAGRMTYALYPAANERAHVLMLYLAFFSPPLFFLIKLQFGLSAFLLTLALWTAVVLVAIALYWKRGNRDEQADEEEEALLAFSWELPEKEQMQLTTAESVIENDRLASDNPIAEKTQPLPTVDTEVTVAVVDDTAIQLTQTGLASKEIAAMAAGEEDSAAAKLFSDENSPVYIHAPIHATSPEHDVAAVLAQPEVQEEEAGYDIEHFYSRPEDKEGTDENAVLPDQEDSRERELLSDLSALLEEEHVLQEPSRALQSRQEQALWSLPTSPVLQMESLEVAAQESAAAMEQVPIEQEKSRLYELEELMQPLKE
ncbi:hypothetical protein ACTID9_09425 [Brevibacillus fluminis]|uniref:hypothetical protein n=1 Tax=Brevibacillus fluminis TaxID=511487 RepID=UPI003F89C169